MDVQLKVNIIMPGGRFVPYGTVLDREEIPPDIRKERYYGAPGEVEPLYASEPEGQGGGGSDDDDEPKKSEPPQPIPPPPPPTAARQSPLRRGGGDTMQ
jgi:hypothetical protein